MISHEWVWIFNGNGMPLPSGVFEDKAKAELWIKRYSLSGTLTQYPVNISAYDWALEHGLFIAKKEHQKTPDFIGRFTAGFIWHDHYDNEHIPVIANYEDAIESKVFAVTGWIWVFNGDGGIFPSGVFETQDKAELWIKHYSLSGTLSKYPVGISVYEYAIQNNTFAPKTEFQRNADFISTFGRGYIAHTHNKNGFQQDKSV